MKRIAIRELNLQEKNGDVIFKLYIHVTEVVMVIVPLITVKFESYNGEITPPVVLINSQWLHFKQLCFAQFLLKFLVHSKSNASGSITCYFITSISLLSLYDVYFILIYCFNDFDFICGLERLSEYSKDQYYFRCLEASCY